jgi:hypothetical protein
MNVSDAVIGAHVTLGKPTQEGLARDLLRRALSWLRLGRVRGLSRRHDPLLSRKE